MNDLLKLLSRSLQPFGYHVRKHKAPNLLKIPALETSDNAQNVKAVRHSGFLPADSKLDEMVIFVRTCVRANRNIDARPRVTGASLEENTLRCLRSLVRSVNHAQRAMIEHKISVVFLDDRSDPLFQAMIRAVAGRLSCLWSLEQTKETGQGASLHEQFTRARAENALVYFCEDDYLHAPDAIAVCWQFYKDITEKLGTHSLLYPQEHAVLYDDLYPSYLLAGMDRHWRSMRHATHTFLTHGHVVNKFWDYFENTKFVGNKKHRRKGSEARTTNKLFRHIPGFSPLKPAAVHLQFENTLPPLYDWRPLWEANADPDSALA